MIQIVSYERSTGKRTVLFPFLNTLHRSKCLDKTERYYYF